MSVFELSGACFIDTSPSANGGVSFVCHFFFLKSPFKFFAAIWDFHYDFKLNINHFGTLEVKANHKNFPSALGSLRSLMGGWVNCIFFLPHHVFLIPEVLITQNIIFKIEYMEECLERPTET